MLTVRDFCLMQPSMTYELPQDPASLIAGYPSDTEAHEWQLVGTVRSLYTRLSKEPAPRPVSHFQALANFGIAGDKHASPNSPRQLLIADEVTYRRFQLPEAALRENLLVDFSTEHLRSGDLLRLGSEVVLWLTFHCEPCSLLERRCPGTIKSIGDHRGMLARVLCGGFVRTGDPIQISRSRIRAMCNDWQGRVLRVAGAVPPGQFIVYRQLAELAGVANAYCRAFPRVLSKLPVEVAARVRSGASAGMGRQWDGAGFFDMHIHLSGDVRKELFPKP